MQRLAVFLLTATIGVTVACDQLRAQDSEPNFVPVLDLRVGQCIDGLPRTERDVYEVRVVDCNSDSATARVIDRLRVSVREYPTVSYFDRFAESRCPDSYTHFFYPSPDSWDDGDRTVKCLVEW